MPGKVTVTYLHHSGFLAAVGETLLIFDYWQGENNQFPVKARLKKEDLASYKQVIVFVTHAHEDHFDRVIYSWKEWKPDISYVIASDMPKDAEGIRMQAGDVHELGDVKIEAFSSTDLGVSFLCTIGDLRLFHAGDLNLWHWREESTLRQITEATESFYRACEPLEKLDIDVCMFPLDPRQGAMYDAGINHFVLSVKPHVLIPMHWQGRSEVVLDYARKGRTRFTEILAMTKTRERADIEREIIKTEDGMEKEELRLHMHTPQKGLYDDEKEETGDDQANPFRDTDLPVDIEK